MSTVNTLALTFVLACMPVAQNYSGQAKASRTVDKTLVNCPPTDEDALRHLRLIINDDAFSDFVVAIGVEVNPDNLVAVKGRSACMSLTSALLDISAQADPAYYEFSRYDRSYFVGNGIYFAVEWPKPPMEPMQAVSGPTYFRAFGPDFVLRARISL